MRSSTQPVTPVSTRPAGFEAIKLCLAVSDPAEKCRAVARLWQRVLEQGFDGCEGSAPLPISAPGRPARPVLVEPQKVPRRRLGSPAGRAALVHAVAHIEFNAINLALDAAYRFRAMPGQFYLDWLSVAADEARHFQLLEQRLAGMGHAYGDFPAHNGLWEMAERTAEVCLQRMALVPRVLEARGLDVTPGMIERLRDSGDLETVAALEIILEEEVRHVEIGSRWFKHCCALAGLEPEATFLQLLKTHYQGRIRGPFNVPARRQAGFTAREMDALEKLR